jgi:hypothetical protein
MGIAEAIVHSVEATPAGTYGNNRYFLACMDFERWRQEIILFREEAQTKPQNFFLQDY